jgi:hypothetical protein
MQLYKLLVARKVTMTSHVWVEGHSAEDAMTRFQHQLESQSCSGIEDDAAWGEAYYYQVVKAGPYAGEFEVLDAEVEPVINEVIAE